MNYVQILNENFINKYLKESADDNRQYYIDEINNIYQDKAEHQPNLIDSIEAILISYNASEDDTNSPDGLYTSMDLDDLKSAYTEIKQLSDNMNHKESPEYIYKLYKSYNKPSDYEQGWIDGYESCKEIRR